jgi:hypothetical protein
MHEENLAAYFTDPPVGPSIKGFKELIESLICFGVSTFHRASHGLGFYGYAASSVAFFGLRSGLRHAMDEAA